MNRNCSLRRMKPTWNGSENIWSRVYAGDINAFNRHSFRQLDSFDQFAFAGTGSEGGFSGYTEKLLWMDFVSLRLQEILAEIKAVIRASGDMHPVHVNPACLAAQHVSARPIDLGRRPAGGFHGLLGPSLLALHPLPE